MPPALAAEAIESPLLYQDVARRVLKLIERGAFRPGDRIPSVRALSRQQGVSVTTVLEAYRVLEDRGDIEARPQSGYFVRARILSAMAEPRPSSPPQSPRAVDRRELIRMNSRDALDPKLVQLGAAFPPEELLPLERLSRSLGRVARRSRHRGSESPAGRPELLRQIARRSLLAGYTASPEDIVITNGCRESIYYALAATCRPGDTVAVESPTFYGFLQAIEFLGLKVIELRTYPREGICIDSVARVLRTHRIKAFLLTPSFNNPIGSLMPDRKKEALVEMLARRDIPLIEDDIAGDLGCGPDRPRAAKSWDRKGLVLLCSSFTKTLAPGYRVGWIVPGRYRAAIEQHKSINNLSTAPLLQLAIADFLAHGGYDRHLRKIRRTYATNVAQMVQAVGESFPVGTRVSRPQGGFVVWVELPRGVDSLRVYERALEAGITITPGALFSPKRAYRNFVRLNAGRWSETIRRAVATLGRIASA